MTNMNDAPTMWYTRDNSARCKSLPHQPVMLMVTIHNGQPSWAIFGVLIGTPFLMLVQSKHRD